jgi:hypothetical protein
LPNHLAYAVLEALEKVFHAFLVGPVYIQRVEQLAQDAVFQLVEGGHLNDGPVILGPKSEADVGRLELHRCGSAWQRLTSGDLQRYWLQEAPVTGLG